jgi:uncharacterized protein (TIGR00255 family)
MLRSMTGFGASSSAGEHGYALRVEVRSVNHRHLAFKARLPEEFAGLEGEIEARVRAHCERGSVSVHVAAERMGTSGLARVDRAAARLYLRELIDLSIELELPATLSLDTLIGLPGVVAMPQGEEQRSALREAALGLVDDALERMVEMRSAEGKALTADLRRNAEALAALVQRIEKRMPMVVRAHRTNLLRRVRDLAGQRVPLAPGDLAREVALLSDRLDVSEEITRLKSHLGQLDTLVKKAGRTGRQLDFLVQEILREVNTIGSKCSDAKVAHWVIEAKTHVERLREQVQNVE